MREFKFRIWDENLKKFLKNTEYKDFAINTQGQVYCISGYFDNAKVDEYDGVEISQYTGLKDKNGVEIYEGDIIKAKTVMVDMPIWIGEVMRECDFYGLDCNQETGWVIVDKKLNSCMAFYPNQDREIIGNIYENEDLLK